MNITATLKRVSRKNKGIVLVTAIFILIILALMSTVAVSLTNMTRSTSSYAMSTARAYYAARAAMEWHAAQIETTHICPAAEYEYTSIGSFWVSTTLNYTNGNLKDFYVRVQCVQQGVDVTENGNDVRVFQITAQAFETVTERALFTRRNMSMSVVVQCPGTC